MSIQIQKPRTVVAPTKQESLTLVQNLLRSSFSTIAYLREIFPEEYFEDVKLNGMSLKKLKRGISATVDRLNDWLEKGCFDAIEKQYLQSIVFSIYVDADDPTTLIESYHFTFKYFGQQAFEMVVDSSNCNFKRESLYPGKSKKESVKAMMGMLRRILVMTQALQPINEPPQVAMKILYYENVTPHDYEPPNFRKALPNEYDSDEIKLEQFELGTVDTNHHVVGLQVRTTGQLVESEEDQEDNSNSQSELNTSSFDHDLSRQAFMPYHEMEVGSNGTSVNPLSQLSNLTHVLDVLNQTDKQPLSQDTVLTRDRNEEMVEFYGPESNQHPARHQPSQPMKHAQDENDRILDIKSGNVDCLCGSTIIDMAMIVCIYCMNLNHPHCCGYYNDQDRRIPKSGHCCYRCSNEVIHSAAYDLDIVANTTIIRRGLMLCQQLGGISTIGSFASALGVTNQVSKQVVEFLKRIAFVKEAKRRKNKQPLFAYTLASQKSRTAILSHWMSDDSLPMNPCPPEQEQAVSMPTEPDVCGMEDEETAQSQEILGVPVSSWLNVSSRSPSDFDLRSASARSQSKHGNIDNSLCPVSRTRSETALSQMQPSNSLPILDSDDVLVKDSLGSNNRDHSFSDIIDNADRGKRGIDAEGDFTQDDQALVGGRGVKRAKMSIAMREASQEF